MSTSHNAVKIWNPSTGDCLRTIESGYGLCSAFVGNRFALVGTKSGTLEIIDIASGSLTEVIEAHAGSIRSIIPIPDEDGTAGARGFVTGSADHDVKFWEYQQVQKSANVSVLSISYRMPRVILFIGVFLPTFPQISLQ